MDPNYERSSNEIKKSMAYDLISALENDPEKQTYSVLEIENLIHSYIRETSKSTIFKF